MSYGYNTMFKSQRPNPMFLTNLIPHEDSKPIISNKPSETPQSNISQEFQTLINEKLGKIDEILVALKEKQEEMSSSIQKQGLGFKLSEIEQEKVGPELNSTFKAETKAKRNPKKSYFSITEQMWSNLKSNFPELSDNYKNQTFSDGDSFYVNINGSKKLLDNKLYLKLLNIK